MLVFPIAARNAAPLTSPAIKHAFTHVQSPLSAIHTSAPFHSASSVPAVIAPAAIVPLDGNDTSTPVARTHNPLPPLRSSGLSTSAHTMQPRTPLMRCTSTLPPVFTPPVPGSPPTPATPSHTIESYFNPLNMGSVSQQSFAPGVQARNAPSEAYSSVQGSRRQLAHVKSESLTLHLTSFVGPSARFSAQSRQVRDSFAIQTHFNASTKYPAAAAAYNLVRTSMHEAPIERFGLGIKLAGLSLDSTTALDDASEARSGAPEALHRSAGSWETREEEDDKDSAADAEMKDFEDVRGTQYMDLEVSDGMEESEGSSLRPCKDRVQTPFYAPHAADSWLSTSYRS